MNELGGFVFGWCEDGEHDECPWSLQGYYCACPHHVQLPEPEPEPECQCDFLQFMLSYVYDALGPAADDIMMMAEESYKESQHG